MATALNLQQAAGQAYDNLHIRWLANQMRSRCILLCQNTVSIFPEQLPGGLPVANWIAILWAQAVKFPSSNVPISDLTIAAESLYRMCWMGFSIINNGITTTQASLLLAQVNSIIGF